MLAIQTNNAVGVNGSCGWVKRITLPCEEYPQGLPGILEIATFTKRGQVRHSYNVYNLFDELERPVGYRLVRRDNEDCVYDINLEWGWSQAECTCGDCNFRSRRCKHSLALEAALRRIHAA